MFYLRKFLFILLMSVYIKRKRMRRRYCFKMRVVSIFNVLLTSCNEKELILDLSPHRCLYTTVADLHSEILDAPPRGPRGSVCVTPQVNLRNPLRIGDKACKGMGMGMSAPYRPKCSQFHAVFRKFW